ncbi:MAG TPA: hypothetical protein VFA52_02010 [Candidatus Paceibacterota bacterium]|nr:hypothetical protein [Candidatus Paceibacterota bacterium]
MNILIELLLAIFIFGIIASALITVFFNNQTALPRASLYLEALTLGAREMDKYKHLLSEDFYNNIATTTHASTFEEDITTEEIDNFTKRLIVGFNWFYRKRPQHLEESTLVSNFNDAIGSHDCWLNGTENWQNAAVSQGPDLGYGNQATALWSVGNLVYLTTNNADPRNKLADPNDLFVIEVKDPANPKILSALDTGPGLTSIQVAGSIAYLGNSSINSQLQIADISDPTKPTILKSYKLPGDYSDETTITSSLFFHQNFLFLGTAKSQIEELHIINVSNPTAPAEVGKWETNAAINSIYGFSHYLFLATPNNAELTLLDVATSSKLILLNNFDATGGSGNGKSLARDRSILFLGRTVGKSELYILSLAHLPVLELIGTKTIGDSINALLALPQRLLLLTNHNFFIYDSSDLKNLKQIYSLNLPAKGTGLSCSGQTIYISILNQTGLIIIQPK